MAITYDNPALPTQPTVGAREMPAVPRGLPAPLPRGEHVEWQGAPRWTQFAVQVFHVRAVAVLLAVIAAWQATVAIADGGTLVDATGRVTVIAIAGGLGLGILCLLAWLVERTTVYTITNRRIVMRIGVAIPKTLDIPFGIIQNAALVETGRGTGNIALDLGEHSKIAYALLWPHARPWHVRDPQPLLRALPDAALVAEKLAAGLVVSRSAAPETTPAPESRFTEVDEHRNTAPRKMVMAMAALALFSLALAAIGASQRDGNVTVDYGEADRAVALRIVDTGPDAFDLVDTDGAAVASVTPGREGLLRNARRAFEGRRARHGVAMDLPYALTVWKSGALTLHDPETGQNIRLDFFGRAPEGPLRNLHVLAGIAD